MDRWQMLITRIFSFHRFIYTMVMLVIAPALAVAQELEPRAYINAPVGFNFFIVGYANSEGGLSTDPSLPVEDAHLQIDPASSLMHAPWICGGNPASLMSLCLMPI